MWGYSFPPSVPHQHFLWKIGPRSSSSSTTLSDVQRLHRLYVGAGQVGINVRLIGNALVTRVAVVAVTTVFRGVASTTLRGIGCLLCSIALRRRRVGFRVLEEPCHRTLLVDSQKALVFSIPIAGLTGDGGRVCLFLLLDRRRAASHDADW